MEIIKMYAEKHVSVKCDDCCDTIYKSHYYNLEFTYYNDIDLCESCFKKLNSKMFEVNM